MAGKLSKKVSLIPFANNRGRLVAVKKKYNEERYEYIPTQFDPPEVDDLSSE